MPGYKIAKEAFKNQESYKKYRCLSCSYLLRTAVQSAVCGHWFCEGCISQLLKTSAPICPSCQENLKSDDDLDSGPGYFPDKFVRRDIDALDMVCLYQASGCQWEGTFGKLQGHLANCNFSVCGSCQMRITTDPSEHECESYSYSCPLSVIGCPASTFDNKEALEMHMKSSELPHSVLLASGIVNLKITNSATAAQQVTKVEADGPGDSGFKSGNFASGSFRSRGTTERDNVVKKSPRTSGRIDHAALVTESGASSMKGDPKMKHELEAVKRDLKAKDEEISSLRAMVNKLEKTQRAKIADFEDRDFRLSLIENSNYDGSMVWKIPQFSQRMSDAQSGKYTSIFSLPFYTGRYGYKMCLRLYILGDGIGKGGYMSLFFVLMKGEFDNILQWPFTHKVTFKLLNQAGGRDIVDTFQPDPMSTSFRKPRSDMNIASGCPRFVSHTDLKSGGYIVDDTVFIKCLTDVNAVKHP